MNLISIKDPNRQFEDDRLLPLSVSGLASIPDAYFELYPAHWLHLLHKFLFPSTFYPALSPLFVIEPYRILTFLLKLR